MPLRTTAVGQVLLAYSAPDVLEELLAQTAGPDAGSGEPPAGDLRAVLAGVKQSGAAVVRRTHPSRTVSVAAAIYAADGAVLAALSIVVPDTAAPALELVPLVRAAARAISRSLGHQATVSGAWRHPSREAGAQPA